MSPSRTRRRVMWTCTALFALCSVPCEALAQKRVSDGFRVLLLSGGDRNHHGYRAQSYYLQNVLEDSGVAEVTMTEEAAVLESSAIEKYDCIVMNADRRRDEYRLNQPQQEALLRYVAGGKGFVAIHGFCCAARDWKPEMRQLLGGVLSHVGQPDTKVRHGKYTVKVTKPGHPVMRGIEQFEHEDELYYELQTVDKLDALATVRHEGQDWPIAWTRQYGKGRVFATVFGHCSWRPGSPDPQTNPPFRKMIVQAIQWAAQK